MKRQITMLALVAALAAPSVFAVTNAQLKAVKKSINAVPVPELPAKAAELVSQTAKDDREAVAITVVRAAITKSRSSAPQIVAAVSKAAPEVAAPVSRVAAEMETGQAGNIAAAATTAAPNARAEITSSVEQGVSGSSSSSSISTLAEANDAGAVGESSLLARGSGRTVHGGGHGQNKSRPINEAKGGRGNGRFPTSPPHGGNPPGHDPDHKGRPDFVDYTKPRRF